MQGFISRPTGGGSTGGGAANIISGTGSPQGSVSATGPAVYMDNSNPSEPKLWVKSTSGTSSNQWVLVGTFSNS